MTEILVLLDYYNLPPICRGREMKYKDHESKVNYLTSKLVQYLDLLKMKKMVIKQRYYGGWFDEYAKSTNDRDMLSAIAKKIFPTVIGNNRYLLNFADGPLDSDVFLHGTVRIEPGLPNFSLISSSQKCRNNPCWFELLLSWRKGQCPGFQNCQHTDTDLIYTKKQKVVDTLIVADAIYYELTTKNSCIIMSHDDDILPSILYDHSKSQMTILRPNREKPSIYENLNNDGYRLINI